ncbi:hypothetical protein [Pseudonocardia dioxanivorans]|nr:hypothetical protein [Pseudonocardia dioxanivorans]
MRWWRPVGTALGVVVALAVALLLLRLYGVPGMSDVRATVAAAGL